MTPFKMKLTPAQCRAARALLGWKQADLALRAHVTTKTVADFERGAREPLVQTIAFIRYAFEEGGVTFFDPEEGVGGIGLRLKWGVEPGQAPGSESRSADVREGDEPTQSAAAMRTYWATHAEQWRRLSLTGQSLLSEEMFGKPDRYDDLFPPSGAE